MSVRKFDARSEKVLDTLHPAAERAMRRLLAALNDDERFAGLEVKAISGLRTYGEQAELFARGRTTPGPVVTNAKPGFSWHNFGVAIDIGIFRPLPNGKEDYLEVSPLYAVAGAIGKALGLEWGGDWKMRDTPHFQVKVPFKMSEARARVAKGLPLLPDEEEDDTWTVLFPGWSQSELPEEGGKVWMPARAALSRVYGSGVVFKMLKATEAMDSFTWGGERTGVKCRRGAEGSLWCDAESLGGWLGLKASRDEKKRTLALSRP